MGLGKGVCYKSMIQNGKKYLVTTASWFIAPDGEEYRAVWGVAKCLETKETFGFTPNRNHANWVYEIGDGDGKITIAGCQVLYAIQSDKPPLLKTEMYTQESTKCTVPINKIYLADQP